MADHWPAEHSVGVYGCAVIEYSDKLTALLPAVAAWFEAERRVTVLLCDPASEKEGEALAKTLLLPREARPADAEWLVTGMYVPLTVPFAAVPQMKEVVRTRTVHRVSLHSHGELGEVMYAYADELMGYPNVIYRRLTLAPCASGAQLVQSAESCGGCRGTRILKGHRPKGGPYPTSGTNCDRCDGQGFVTITASCLAMLVHRWRSRGWYLQRSGRRSPSTRATCNAPSGKLRLGAEHVSATPGASRATGP